MKRIGINRNIDSLGRLVIPKEMRDYLNIGKCDKIEIIAFNNGVFLKKAEPISSDLSQGSDDIRNHLV